MTADLLYMLITSVCRPERTILKSARRGLWYEERVMTQTRRWTTETAECGGRSIRSYFIMCCYIAHDTGKLSWKLFHYSTHTHIIYGGCHMAVCLKILKIGMWNSSIFNFLCYLELSIGTQLLIFSKFLYSKAHSSV